jgi:hypothetical protein
VRGAIDDEQLSCFQYGANGGECRALDHYPFPMIFLLIAVDPFSWAKIKGRGRNRGPDP